MTTTLTPRTTTRTTLVAFGDQSPPGATHDVTIGLGYFLEQGTASCIVLYREPAYNDAAAEAIFGYQPTSKSDAREI